MDTQKLIQQIVQALQDSGNFDGAGVLGDPEQLPAQVYFVPKDSDELCWITVPEQDPIIRLLLDLEQKTALLSYHDEEHPLFQKIVDHGEEAVPRLVRYLQRYRSWYAVLALTKITGEWPVPSDHAGRLDEIVNDWLKWSKENFYID